MSDATGSSTPTPSVPPAPSNLSAAERADKNATTPAMRQYREFKRQYPEYVLFFRMGDFYEMFWEDAKLANKTLGVALTTRSRGGLDDEDAIPMAGVPFHAVESYLRKMIAAGHKVAICEQAEDPATAKGLIRREVVRLMTPGTLTDEHLLDGRTDNYLAAVAFGVSKSGGYKAALAWVELSTGAFLAMSGTQGQVLDEIARLRPAELLVPEHASGQPHEISKSIESLGIKNITARPEWQFSEHHAREEIARQWNAATAEGFGFDNDDPAVLACGAILTYLAETQRGGPAHLRTLRQYRVQDYLAIDPATWRSLEVDRTVRSGSVEGALLWAIDRTRTAMGARMLRQWLRSPLCELEHIAARQSAIAALLDAPVDLKQIVQDLGDICDIERIIARVSVSRASPRDLAGLARCLANLPKLLDRLTAVARFAEVTPELLPLRGFCQEQGQFLVGAIMPDPAPHLREGNVIADGFDAELDRLRDISNNSQQWLVKYQARLAGETGIPSLRVSYNKVFGYYIEVTDAHRSKVPQEWTRRQTVKNAERYITSELKNFENEALGARDRSIALEQNLFEQVRQRLLPHVPAYQELAYALARLDVLSSLAVLAQERKYCRPEVTDDRVLRIIDGRHPVLEQQLGSEFVSNDLRFDADDSLQLITGPNMAGKSTFIRQVALITLMAQIGSYVPAKSAMIGLADRIFTRVGASDELHSGQSTFMVEMIETANILNNATDRSLVILDEVGRGTSTLDGLSLAWAIAEHIASTVRCRTLFATHYHELTDLARRFQGVKNLNVSVREWEDQVIFLHRIVEGGTDRSYGIHVARLAGVPRAVLDRARQLLGELAVHHVNANKTARHRRVADEAQMELFVDPGVEVIRAVAGVDPDQLTPLQALALIQEWKKKLR